MDKFEFIDKVLGVQWVNRGVSMDAMDCFGLVYLYYKNVLGIELGGISGERRDKKDQLIGYYFHMTQHEWEEIPRPTVDSVVFVNFDHSGRPRHTGIVISRTDVLHCSGSRDLAGGVQISSIHSLESSMGKAKYFQYIGDVKDGSDHSDERPIRGDR